MPLRFGLALVCLILPLVSGGCNGCASGLMLGGEDGAESKRGFSLTQALENIQGLDSVLDVPVVVIVPSSIVEQLDLGSGDLIPRESVIVYPETEGRLRFNRIWEVGDKVEKNQVIAQIDDVDILDDIDQQRKSIELSAQDIKFKRLDLGLKKNTLDQDRNLARKKFISEQELQSSEMSVEQAQIGLEQAGISLEQEETRLQKLLRDHERMPITAPMSGTIVLASHLQGERSSIKILDEEIMQRAGMPVSTSTAICGIISDDAYHARVNVNAKDKARLAVGQKADIKVHSYTTINVTGTVVEIDNIQDMNSHAYRVLIKLDHVDESFSSGQFCNVNVELARREPGDGSHVDSRAVPRPDRSVPVLPSFDEVVVTHHGAPVLPSFDEVVVVVDEDFVKEEGNQKFVQLVVNGVVTNVPVTTGIVQSRRVEITSGLKYGDLLIALKKTIAPDQRVKAVVIETE